MDPNLAIAIKHLEMAQIYLHCGHPEEALAHLDAALAGCEALRAKLKSPTVITPVRPQLEID